MMMNKRRMTVMLAAAVMTGLVLQAPASEIPLQLPKPDGKPGDATKKVKVYFLGGQPPHAGHLGRRGAGPQRTATTLFEIEIKCAQIPLFIALREIRR